MAKIFNCDLTFSHSCERKKNNNSREERNLTRQWGREDGRRRWKEWKHKTGITALNCLLLILPPLHTKTFDAFQCLNPTLPVTPTHSGLYKLTQHGSTHSQAHSVSSLCPLCLSDSMKSALRRRWGALVCFTPASPSYLLSSILHVSALLWGPIRPLCRSMACG